MLGGSEQLRKRIFNAILHAWTYILIHIRLDGLTHFMLLRVHAHFYSYSNRWFKGNENLLKPERFAKMKFLLGSSAAFFMPFHVFTLILDGSASLRKCIFDAISRVRAHSEWLRLTSETHF